MTMCRHNLESLVASILAYAIVIQALLSAFGPGFLGQVHGDRFNAEICLSGAGYPGAPAIPGDPAADGHEECCVLCSLPAFQITTDHIGIILAVNWSCTTCAIPSEIADSLGTIDLLPGNPRAPPRAA